MHEAEFLKWLHDLWIGNLVRTIPWMFPTLETLHFLGLSMLFGAVLIFDLRMLGFAKQLSPAASLKLIWVAVVAFAVNAASGFAFVSNDPYMYWDNPAFRWKMLFIALAGLNALWFAIVEQRKVEKLGVGGDVDIASKAAAILSITFWVVVILLGRLMPTYDGAKSILDFM